MKSIEDEIADILDTYNDEVREKSEAICKKVASECRAELKKTSPKGSSNKHYADGWSVKRIQVGHLVSFVVRNAKKPGLTHLLEHGHVIKNQYGTYGRAPAHPHMAEAEEKYVKELEARLKVEL